MLKVITNNKRKYLTLDVHFCLLSSADVSITLRNKGRDAYKPEVYGSAIILDLRITRDGLRTYKLRSKSGKNAKEFVNLDIAANYLQ